MQLTPRLGYYLWPKLELPTLPSGRNLASWAPGKHLSAHSKARGFLTNGTDDDTFLGCKWVQGIGDSQEYMVVNLENASRLIFLTPEIEPVFVGSPLMRTDGTVAPLRVAIPKAAIHPASTEFFNGKTYLSRVDAVLKALSELDPKITVQITSTEACSFVAKRPLLPSVWSALGFHALSEQNKATRDVVPQSARASRFQLPFSHIEQGGKYGVHVVTPIACTPQGLDCTRFLVTDPALAANLIPALASLPVGAEVEVVDGFAHPGYDGTRFAIPAADILSHGVRVRPHTSSSSKATEGDLPEKTVNVTYSPAQDTFVLPFFSTVLTPGTALTVTINSKDLAYLVSSDALDQFADRKQNVPDPAIRGVQPQPRPLYLDGVKQEDRFYRRSETIPRPTATEKRKQRDVRFEALTKKHGALPPYWAHLSSDEQVAAAVEWEARRASGWLTLPEFAISIGLSPTHSGLSTWLQKIDGIKTSVHPMKSMEMIVQPLSFEEIAALPGFPDHIEDLLPGCVGFAIRCGLSETARTALFGKLMGA